MVAELIETTERGLFCSVGDFYIDPWKPVSKAVLTHAHSDHARPGSGSYLAVESGRRVMETRLGAEARIEYRPFGEPTTVNGVSVTFYPAGHILGSAQVKIEKNGFVAVVSGDYKRESDPTCRPFEVVRCHQFVTESTFGLPIYRWPDPESVFGEINRWWKANQEAGKASLLLAYSLGKAQRLLAGIDASIGPIYTHGAVEKLNEAYRASGVRLPQTTYVGAVDARQTNWKRALIVAPPSAHGTPWTRRFGKLSSALASGWMQIRGTRRRRSVDRGFILSDHVDWQGLMTSIHQTEAESIWVTHGYSSIVVRHLREQGANARSIDTEFQGELLDESATVPTEGSSHDG